MCMGTVEEMLMWGYMSVYERNRLVLDREVDNCFIRMSAICLLDSKMGGHVGLRNTYASEQ